MRAVSYTHLVHRETRCGLSGDRDRHGEYTRAGDCGNTEIVTGYELKSIRQYTGRSSHDRSAPFLGDSSFLT